MIDLQVCADSSTPLQCERSARRCTTAFPVGSRVATAVRQKRAAACLELELALRAVYGAPRKYAPGADAHGGDLNWFLTPFFS
jgi:hypothetical protein